MEGLQVQGIWVERNNQVHKLVAHSMEQLVERQVVEPKEVQTSISAGNTVRELR